MNRLEKSLSIAAIVVFVSMAFLMYYGHKTQCKNVAIYVKCYNF
jgi:uncharacterized protein (UPF0333 family)